MKIKLSKSKWEEIGSRSGWMKRSAQPAIPSAMQTRPEAMEQLEGENVDLNTRQLFILRSYNNAFGQSVPENIQGYRETGGSTKMIQAIAKDPQAFIKFITTEIDKVDENTRFNLAKNIALQVSRV